MKTASSSRQPRAAFTLVELLVVIGVITVLAGLLLAAVSRAQLAARVAKCAGNMSQIYKASRTYANNFNQMLPDLYAGLLTTEHAVQYVNNHYCRNESTTGEGETATTTYVPAGLWLLYVHGYARSEELYYCPNTPGPNRYAASQNRLEDSIPKMVGYAYNYFPEMATGESVLLPPEGLTAEEVTNDMAQPRAMGFYALMADVFIRADQMPHWARRGLNVCYWDSSVAWVGLTERGIGWNSQMTNEDGDTVQTFSEDLEGAAAMRDTWVILSKARK